MMSLFWVAIALLVSLLLALFVYTLRLNKRLRVFEEKLSGQMGRLQHDLSTINSAAMGVGQRLISAEKKLRGSMEKQQQFEMNSVDHLPFDQAVSLVEGGADAGQLVDRCGLSEAEAGLMALLQDKKKVVEPA